MGQNGLSCKKYIILEKIVYIGSITYVGSTRATARLARDLGPPLAAPPTLRTYQTALQYTSYQEGNKEEGRIESNQTWKTARAGNLPNLRVNWCQSSRW